MGLLRHQFCPPSLVKLAKRHSISLDQAEYTVHQDSVSLIRSLNPFESDQFCQQNYVVSQLAVEISLNSCGVPDYVQLQTTRKSSAAHDFADTMLVAKGFFFWSPSLPLPEPYAGPLQVFNLPMTSFCSSIIQVVSLDASSVGAPR